MAEAAGVPGAVTQPRCPVCPSPAATVTGRRPPARTPMSSPGWSARATGLAATRAQRTQAAMPGTGALPEPSCPSAPTARPGEPTGGPMTAAVRPRQRRTCAGHVPMPMASRATMTTGPAAGLCPVATPSGTRFRRALRPMARGGHLLRCRGARRRRRQRRGASFQQRGPTLDARIRRRRCTARGCAGTTNLAGGRIPAHGSHHATGRSGPVPPSGLSDRCLRQVGGRCLRQVGGCCLRQVGGRYLQGLSCHVRRIDPGRPSSTCAICPLRLVPDPHGPSGPAPSKRSRSKPRRSTPLLASGQKLEPIFRWRSSNGCARR